jgi:hypothetical protein
VFISLHALLLSLSHCVHRSCLWAAACMIPQDHQRRGQRRPQLRHTAECQPAVICNEARVHRVLRELSQCTRAAVQMISEPRQRAAGCAEGAAAPTGRRSCAGGGAAAARRQQEGPEAAAPSAARAASGPAPPSAPPTPMCSWPCVSETLNHKP